MARPWISKKDSKMLDVLLMTTEVYIAIGQPIGSKTLKEHCCSNLSAATLRNYFSELEAAGFLKKNHASGGRIPTNLAFRYYADYCESVSTSLPSAVIKKLDQLPKESQNIIKDLQKASEILSEVLNLPVCFSFPRFDSDTITQVRLTPVDDQRIVVIISTEFGLVFTDVLWFPCYSKLRSLTIVEDFLHCRIRDQYVEYVFTSQEEEAICSAIYNEIVIRYLTKHCYFSEEDIYQTNLSSLLKYEAFKDPDALSQGLSLLENKKHIRMILNTGMYKDKPTAFIGKELSHIFGSVDPKCVLITTPYFMNRTPLGAFGVLGPVNLAYKQVFATLNIFAEKIKACLTQSFYKFKLSFRTPSHSYLTVTKQNAPLNQTSSIKLLPSKEIK